MEADLLQEHYNRWLEDIVKKRGGDFDDKFYRHTFSPNVDHFLRIKEEIGNAFSLRSRGQTHTSPHLRETPIWSSRIKSTNGPKKKGNNVIYKCEEHDFSDN